MTGPHHWSSSLSWCPPHIAHRGIRRQSNIPRLDAVLVKVHNEERAEHLNGVDRSPEATIVLLPFFPFGNAKCSRVNPGPFDDCGGSPPVQSMIDLASPPSISECVPPPPSPPPSPSSLFHLHAPFVLPITISQQRLVVLGILLGAESTFLLLHHPHRHLDGEDVGKSGGLRCGGR